MALGVACSKTNNVDQSTKLAVGEQCGRPDDPGCGVGAVCVLGFCRQGCTTDAECAQGAICVGDMPPFGCSLPAELACSSSQPCESEALDCGIDGVCRLPCEQDTDCSRNEHHCIAGTCVGDGERDYDTTWAACPETGAAQCVGASFQQCNVTGPGWVEAKNCGADLCSDPDGRCLELVVEVVGAADLFGLSATDGALYWISPAGDLTTSAIEPGSTTSMVLDLPQGTNDEGVRVKGPLLGVVAADDAANFVAQMYRVDGTAILDVPIGSDPQAERMPRQAMPTTAGLFWIESGPGGTPTSGMPVLFYLPADANDTTVPTEIGSVAGNATVPIGAFCAIDDTFYFLVDGALYRVVEGAIEGPLAAPPGSDVACSDSQVFLLTGAGISRIAGDGTATTVVEYPFSAMQAAKGMNSMVLVDDEVFTTSPTGLVAANVVTGEVREIVASNPQAMDTLPFKENLFAADENYLFVVWPTGAPGSPLRILRTPWAD